MVIGGDILKVSDAIVRCLEKEEVEILFGYPGAAVIPLYESLSKGNIKHILVRHEQAAGHSASGYARATGKPGVCIVTSGPGSTNIITAIATAYIDSIPMVVITGQVNSSLIGKDVFQEADITGSTEPFTKHNYLVKDAEDIPRVIKEAFYIATTGRPGPVLIDIPVDIQGLEIDLNYPHDVNIRGYKPKCTGHKLQIKKVLERLKQSSKPLICVGGGVASANAREEFRTFVQKSGIPVVHTLMGKDCIQADTPEYIGLIGSHGYPQANRAVAMADVIILIGTRIADRATGNSKAFAQKADIIHIDIDPAEIGKNINTVLPVVGDASDVLRQLNDDIELLSISSWRKELQSLRDDFIASNSDKITSGLQPDFVCAKEALRFISKASKDDAILVTDVGQNQMWSARNFDIIKNRRFFTSGGLGTMGYGLPAAIGAKLGAPDRNVVIVVGDGGFQMSLFELATLTQCDLNIIIVLLNNSGLGLVREIQRNAYNNPYQVAINNNPDFVKLAEAYGINGSRASSNSEFEEIFQEALTSSKATLIECIVDEKESTF
jgi:acetolactate synthase I/II/III large subunit